MKLKNKIILLLSINLLSILSFSQCTTMQEEHVIKTEKYNETYIKQVESMHQGELLSKEVVLEKIDGKQNINSIPKKRNVLWTITAAQLPVTKFMCEQIESLTCNEAKANRYGRFCKNLCIIYGPELIAFDKKKGKLYLSAHTLSGGNAGWPLLGFVADINNRDIKPFNQLYGPAEIALSPSGKYLVLLTYYHISIINTKTHKELQFENNRQITSDKQHYYTISKLKWLNDTELSYFIEDNKGKFLPGTSIKKSKQIFNIKTEMVQIK